MSDTTEEKADSPRPVDALADDQRRQYHQIVDEIEPYAEKGTVAAAVDNLNRILDQIPEDEEHALLRAGLYARRASLILELDRADVALEDAKRAIEAGWSDAETHATAGWACYSLDRPGAARDRFDRSLQLDPDDVSALTGRAMALLEIEEYDLARSDLTHAINCEAGNADLYALRGEAHIGLRELDKAERDVRKARELEPDDRDHALDLTRLLLVRGETDEAEQAVDDAIGEEEEADLEALLLRSHLKMLSGDSQAARKDAIRASNHYPDEAFAFVQLVHVQLAEGNLSLAQKAAERAVKLDPSLPDAYMVRGAALQMQGKQEEAREDLQRASQAPAELPMFLLGSFFEVLEDSGFNHSMMDLLSQYSSMHQSADGEGPAAGDFGNFDPSTVMDQIFDESGNVNERVKPFVEMALQNAPNILKNLPPGLVQGLGGVDPSELDDVDLSNLSSEEVEQQLKDFYEMMQSGNNPFSMFDGGFDPSNRPDDDEGGESSD